MDIFYTKEFAKMFKRLPADIQELFYIQEKILKVNWRDVRLHIKKLKVKSITFSFRITRSYRAFFYFRSFNSITIYAIGHRKDIHRKLRG